MVYGILSKWSPFCAISDGKQTTQTKNMCTCQTTNTHALFFIIPNIRSPPTTLKTHSSTEVFVCVCMCMRVFVCHLWVCVCVCLCVCITEQGSVELSEELMVNAAATINNLSFYQGESSVVRRRHTRISHCKCVCAYVYVCVSVC